MIAIENTAIQTIIKDAEQTYPDECCGFLFGHEKGEERKIVFAFPVINSKEGDRRRRFEVSALDYMKAERLADEKKLTLLGVYHSHPNHPSVPSETDRQSAQPWFSYIILSLRNGKFSSIQSWRLNDESQQFDEEIIFDQQKNKFDGNSNHSNTTEKIRRK
jgi:proteasome lid subunit RPN8/RPN11